MDLIFVQNLNQCLLELGPANRPASLCIQDLHYLRNNRIGLGSTHVLDASSCCRGFFFVSCDCLDLSDIVKYGLLHLLPMDAALLCRVLRVEQQID